MSAPAGSGPVGERLRFDDVVVVITGAGRGLGRAYAEHLAARGARVVVNNPTVEPGRETVAAITAAGGRAVVDHSDISTPGGGTALIGAALAAFGRVDVVVNNAGISGSRPFDELELDEFERFWRVHAAGHFNVTKAAWPHLVAQGSGRIVNTTSGAGIYGLAPFVAYAAAKGAVNAFTRALALEGAPLGIAVNAIAPAARTRMTDDAAADPDRAAQWEALSAERVAPALAWLAHPSCRSSGEIYEVFGGRVARVVVGETVGFYDPDLTPESLAANLALVDDETDLLRPRHAREVGSMAAAHRAPAAG